MPTIYVSGLEIECQVVGKEPRTYDDPGYAGELYVSAVAVADHEEAADLFEQLGLDRWKARAGQDCLLANNGEFCKVYAWASSDETVWEEANRSER
jgi:DNA/RNA-binding domain of Phe-tRNA-synthetase-like protein